MTGYYANNAYVLSFSQTLHEEFKPDGVAVPAPYPGPVAMEFQERAGKTDPSLGSERRPLSFQRVDRVDRAGYRGPEEGKSVIVPGWDCKSPAALTG